MTLSPPNTISLVTYNIHKGFGLGALQFVLPKMRHALGELHPDLVFLQEVQGAHLKKEKRVQTWPEIPQFEYIAEDFWPHYIYAKNATYRVGHHGNAILSKYPIVHFENLNLSMHQRASRGLLYCQIQLENKRLHLFCVHLGLFKAERAKQCDLLIERINEVTQTSEPLIMAGDFNDWRNHLSLGLEARLGIQEAFHALEGKHARSYPALRPALSVDRVYYRGLTPRSVSCLDGNPWRALSDHLPLYAEFEV